MLDAAADAVEDWALDGREPRGQPLERLAAARAGRAAPTARARRHADGGRCAPIPTTRTPGTPTAIVRTRTGWRGCCPRIGDDHDRSPHASAAGAGATGASRRGRRSRRTAAPAAPQPRRPSAPARPVGAHRAARRDRRAPGARRSAADRRAAASASALRHVTYAAMPHGAKTYLAAALVRATGERLVWVARDAEIADRVAEELAAWLGDPAAVVTLEPRTSLAYERSELVRDESAARVAALAAWAPSDSPARMLVASVQALFQHTLAPDRLPTEPVVLRPRQRLSQERVLRTLVDLGYEAVPEVGGRGEFARRGGIVDVFPAGQPLPVRIEWFGDEIESLRAFDPADQRGVGPVDRGDACCRRASSCSPPTGDRAARPARPAGRPAAGAPRGRSRRARDRDRSATRPRSGPATSRRRTALDHLGDADLVDRRAGRRRRRGRLPVVAGGRAARRARDEPASCPRAGPGAYPGRRDWKRRLTEARTLELTWESEADGAPPGGNPFGWHEPGPAAGRRSGPSRETVERWRSEGARVVLASDQSARLAELLGDADIVAAPTPGPRGGADRGRAGADRAEPQRRASRAVRRA